jgi:hypothetical protein
MTQWEKGDRIEGEKIRFWFGKVVVKQVGKRAIASLGLNGQAIELKPLKRANPETASRKTHKKIRCQSARGEGDTGFRKNKKVEQGNHRVWEGGLDGNASCEVTIPTSRQ